MYEIALIGNPNVGKSSLFNLLTGENVYIGNWPGVTVEKKEGYFDNNYKIIDLPGVYSLSTGAIDEKVTMEYFLKNKPDLVVNIVDATTLDRNLYLTLQLLEMGNNLLMALNKIDLCKLDYKKIKELENILNIKIVPISVKKKVGIEDLKKMIKELCKNKNYVILKYPKLEKYIEEIIDILKEDQNLKEYNLRLLAIKLLENDDYIINIVKDTDIWNKLEKKLNKINEELKKEYNGKNPFEVERLKLIKKIKEIVYDNNEIYVEKDLTYHIDEVLFNGYYGILVVVPLLWMLFTFTFTASKPFMDIIETLINIFSNFIKEIVTNKFLASLLADGIIGGVGAVLVFIPLLLFLYIGISFYEGTGLLARIPILADMYLRKFGLPGKAIIPLILGFGCNVPAILAARTIENEKDRILTIIINPLCSCSARLPIYVLFASAFFSKNQGLVILSLYTLGISLALILSKIFRIVLFKEEPEELTYELPNYHIPSFREIFVNTWERIKHFLRKAGTIILFGSILVWFLTVFGPSGFLGEDVFKNPELIKMSFSAKIGEFLSVIFSPFGWGWKETTALFYGLMAKELVVSSLGILYGVSGDKLLNILTKYFTPVSAYAYMVFTLIYVPCLATLGVIKQELGLKWTIFVMLYLIVLAYFVSLTIFIIGNLIFC